MIGGMDEAGRGPAIGPIVFGIVVADKDQLSTLEELGIDDSKKLSTNKREEFTEIIKQNVFKYDTLAVSASNIDRLRDKITLNKLEVKYFKKLLKPYSKHIRMLQLDAADVNAERFGSHFTSMIEGKVDSRHKGDSIFVSVGAASILAKYERDRIIDDLQKEMSTFDPELPSFGSGYPTQAKPFLESYVQKYGKLPKVARKSWKTSINAFEKYGSAQANLDDFL